MVSVSFLNRAAFLCAIALMAFANNAQAQSGSRPRPQQRTRPTTTQGSQTRQHTQAQQGNAAKQEMGSASKSGSLAFLNHQNVPSTGLALEGYCPVAYFAANKPIKGNSRIASTYKGITYNFANGKAKKMFEKEPAKFVPAYGGWCATGMAIGKAFPVDPQHFKIVNGKLLLFLRNPNVDALSIWDQKSEPESITMANKNWTMMNQ